MHVSWPFVLFVALLLLACIVTARVHALIVRHRIAWLKQEITATGSQIRHTAHISCECCRAQGRRMVIYTYGGDERTPRTAHVCHRCNRHLQLLLSQASNKRESERTAS